jgi:predicted nucleic acid-binding protein
VTEYLVDTNLPSELTKPAPDPRVAEFLIQAGRERVCVSVVTIGEICKGIGALPESKRREELRVWLDRVMRPWFAGRVLTVTENIAERWGTLTGEHRRRGRQITMADGLIAATALEHDLTLVTRNVKDFEGLGLPIINPWEQD